MIISDKHVLESIDCAADYERIQLSERRKEDALEYVKANFKKFTRNEIEFGECATEDDRQEILAAVIRGEKEMIYYQAAVEKQIVFYLTREWMQKGFASPDEFAA